MKKYFLMLVVLTSFESFSFTGSENIEDVRKLFYLASENSSKSEQFLKEMVGVQDDSMGVRKGYLAMAYMLQAKHAWNPYNKLKYFVKGREYLNCKLKIIRIAQNLGF